MEEEKDVKKLVVKPRKQRPTYNKKFLCIDCHRTMRQTAFKYTQLKSKERRRRICKYCGSEKLTAIVEDKKLSE